MWNCSRTLTDNSCVIHNVSGALYFFFISDMLSCNINDRLTPSVQKGLELLPAHIYKHQNNSLGCNLSWLNSSTSRTRNVTSCDGGAFHNMLFGRRDLPLCSWDKWVDQVWLLLLWMLHCLFLQSCFLWTWILFLMNFQPRIFLEISVLSVHRTLQRSNVFLKGFQLAAYAVSHGGVFEFAFGFWWVFLPLGGGKVGVF